MEDAGFRRFPLPLNPTAKEFRPSDHPYTQITDLILPPLFYSYPHNFPPSPPSVYNFPPSPPSTAVLMAPGPHPTLPLPSPVPTRALLLSSVPTDVSESTVRRELEVFGDVRAVQMERLRDGIVTVHFYDLRQAAEALKEIQEQHMQQQFRLRKHFDGLMLSSPANPPPLPPPANGLLSGRAIWAQFTFPVAAGLPDGYNQGTVVIFNLDSTVSTGKLTEIFEAFGCVKEFRDAPLKKNQKLIEFYDTRNAAKAVAAVNGQEIDGKVVVVEFSRLGGSGGGGGGNKYNYKQNKFNSSSHINFTRKPFPATIIPYRPQPPPSPPCYGKDRVVDYGGDNVDVFGAKKNGKGFFKQSPEQQGRWAGGGGGGGCDGGRNKTWKGSRYMREKSDPRFLIKEDGMISSFQDSRTTVMVKNIPNKYSQKLLLNMLDNHCIHCNEQAEEAAGDRQPPSSYDFVYLPIDFVNKCNVGYGFVNMTSPEAARRLYSAFHHQNWEVFNSKKICEVSYARLQGLEALKEHFKNSKFPQEAEEYMPVVFAPPRDGRNLTEPLPIVGRSSSVTSTSPPPTSSSPSSEVGGGRDLTDGRCFLDDNLLVEDVKCDVTTPATTTNGGD